MTGRAEYSPVDRISFSADETAQSLLSQDEKGYVSEGRRPTHRRYNLALKAILLLFVLILHAALVVFLASWLAPTFFGSPGNTKADGVSKPGIKGGHNGDTCQSEDSYRQYTFDGVVRDDYKNPHAEFLHTDPCGQSAAEARARGCRYGMLYGAWLPEACYDEETEENFRKYTDWKFWLQPNRTEERSWDEVAKGEYDYVLVEWEYHQRHCAEMNRRLFTAMARRGLHSIDSYLSQWKHTDHCAHSAMEQRPTHELNAILWRKFPDCGVVRWKN
ncbi:uncharacterized protein BCR38DRAFT_484861 [Pseudomassariella vexata]|uniref:Uncharacterized protein n=1 Tax=Pseudomassariella vexata TaxID=1141098 RepID=A0A1Y2E1M9_9PEZI|nr:uncharacterized protein BCR38DRAFT_484861 [Pseudomassariella vexata]ORY65440.1 hypothetical protein BCR38DRAFT_484861 [Pseudomassariella vexata]